jgi:hypothetical protein
MKRIFFCFFILASFTLSAKKVMFRVNMEGQILLPTGVHVTGDFQTEAGFAADWDPGTTALVPDASDPDVYWCVVDIPAFVHYEFKYVNGDQGYEQEFVPLESRVNYNFIDNRWFYLDSLANDTFMLPAVRFAGNAPEGKSLIRFYVDMTNEASVSANGVHVQNDINAFSTTAAHLFSFDGSVYEYIDYVDSGMSTVHEYKFVNGNTAGNVEALAGWCQNANGYRAIAAPRDTMLPTVCYTFCAACNTVGITEAFTENFKVTPNPANDFVNLTFSSAGQRAISVVDFAGREVINASSADAVLPLHTDALSTGVYFVRSMTANGSVQVQKLVIE